MIATERLNDTFYISEILKQQVFMSSRVARELPKIDIGGTMFYLDLRLNEFREIENFANRINLDEFYETVKGEYKLWFDKGTKNLFLGSPEEFVINTKAVEVTLPSQ